MRKYLAFFTGNIQNVLTFRGPMVIWLISGLLSTATIIIVWQATSGGSTFAGYSKSELISYYLVLMAVDWINSWMPYYWIKEEIKDGSIVNRIIKPISLLGMTMSAEAGWHVISAPLGIIAAGIIAIFFRQYLVFPHDPLTIFLFLIAVGLSILIVCTFSLCMALSAFWFTRVHVLDSFYWSMRFLIGGQGLPIAFLSGIVFQAAILLPFRYMISFPLELYFQKLNSNEILLGFFLQISWCVILVILYKQMLRRGIKSYTAFGN